MAQPLSPEIKQLLDRPNFAHLATLMSDGSPQSVPVWVGREGDRILVCAGEGSLEASNTRRDPRVALSIVDFQNPYMEAQLRGRVVERHPDPDCGSGSWGGQGLSMGDYVTRIGVPRGATAVGGC